jgi:hypothetical protein
MQAVLADSPFVKRLLLQAKAFPELEGNSKPLIGRRVTRWPLACICCELIADLIIGEQGLSSRLVPVRRV